MPCILLCSTAFKQGINHECPGSNPPMFTLYIYARSGYLAARILLLCSTAFKQGIDHAHAFCNVFYFTPVSE